MSQESLSKIDKKMLKALLDEKENDSKPLKLAKELGIPISIYNRRIKYLKNNYIRTYNDLHHQTLNIRKIDLQIEVSGVNSEKVVSELLKRNEVIRVCRRIGGKGPDIRATIVIRDDFELTRCIGEIKSIEGVCEVNWSEVIEVVRKKSIPDHIIDDL